MESVLLFCARLKWQQQKIKRAYFSFLSSLGGAWFIALRWPWPSSRPWRRKSLRIAAPGKGIGDELMCLPVLQELKRRNPTCVLTFVARNFRLFAGQPFIDRLEPAGSEPNPSTLRLEYAYKMPPPRPIITHLAESLGLQLTTKRLIPPNISPDRELCEQIEQIPKPRIVIQPEASKWTPNKDWPTSRWDELVDMLLESGSVIEVGVDSRLSRSRRHTNFHSYVGRTDLEGFAYIIREAQLFIGPPSGGMHLANAFGVPSVIIFGGYESPGGFEYSKTTPLFTKLPCSPCWLTTPCPYDKKCLTAISPASVKDAALGWLRMVESTPINPP